MSFGKVLRRISSPVVFIVFLAAALCAAALLPYFLAAWLTNILLLALTSVACFAAVLWLDVWICARLWGAAKPERFVGVSAAILSVLFVVLLYFTVLQPHTSQFTETQPYDDTRYWQLSTGSRIAYSEFDPPAGVVVKPDPIVFLHGGPGLRVAPFDRDAYSSFSADGFRVILYDQVGSGLSGFLPHIRDYSIHRSVEDLEAIRQELHADRMILIGHSWGSTLAASYMARYPNRVSKVVFHSPGKIWNLSQDTFDFSGTDGGSQAIPPPRLLAAFLLQPRNPDTTENLLPQKEAEELFAPTMGPAAGGLVCKGDSQMLPRVFLDLQNLKDNPGFNPFILQGLVLQTSDPGADPHPALRGNQTPAILLFGECNYLSWAGAEDYRQTFSKLKIYYIPRAGHYIQFEQPELMHRIIRAFLLDQPDPISPYAEHPDPRSAKP